MPDEILIFPRIRAGDHGPIADWVQGSYWGSSYTRFQIVTAVEESAMWGAYLPHPSHQAVPGQIIGFVRALTDTAIFSSITDVYVDEAHRNKGVGSALMNAVMRDPRICSTICILQARPAAQLWYQKNWDFVLVSRENGIMQRFPK